MTLISEIERLIKEWERAHPGFTGKIVLQLNYLGGKAETIQEFTYNMRTIKMT